MLQCSLPKADIVLYPKEFKTKPISRKAAVKLMRTRIGLLARPKSMRSTVDATQREQRHGLA
ncbi:MAG: hypothetical protein ACI85H_001644 [Paracoccaceae bacterium]|jgi:hypothetical protein